MSNIKQFAAIPRLIKTPTIFFNNNGLRGVYNRVTHNYTRLAHDLAKEGNDELAVIDELVARFEHATRNLWDKSIDVGGVVEYYKRDLLVAYFNYFEHKGAILSTAQF
jgi:hypothetical protein